MSVFYMYVNIPCENPIGTNSYSSTCSTNGLQCHNPALNSTCSKLYESLNNRYVMLGDTAVMWLSKLMGQRSGQCENHCIGESSGYSKILRDGYMKIILLTFLHL